MTITQSFDPDAAAISEGLFGLPFTRDQSKIIVIPVPFDATTSYGGGTVGGPSAILKASRQVDLYDRQFGRVWEPGIFMDPIDRQILALSASARTDALPIIENGGAEEKDLQALDRVRQAGDLVNEFVSHRVKQVLAEGKIPVVLGGDHSTPFASIQACAERGPIGILQIDAHMDFREAYEGFQWSHASIMYNVLEQVDGIDKVVQVGIRDFGEQELSYAESDKRVTTYYDEDLARSVAAGRGFAAICDSIAIELPSQIYLTCDIDGLEPSLCPHTGTPVPGGLSFREFNELLSALVRHGKRIVGFDLVEVCPSESGEWDANVGARVLYKLCGLAGVQLKQ